jgi:hypothetical protein
MRTNSTYNLIINIFYNATMPILTKLYISAWCKGALLSGPLGDNWLKEGDIADPKKIGAAKSVQQRLFVPLRSTHAVQTGSC